MVRDRISTRQHHVAKRRHRDAGSLRHNVLAPREKPLWEHREENSAARVAWHEQWIQEEWDQWKSRSYSMSMDEHDASVLRQTVEQIAEMPVPIVEEEIVHVPRVMNHHCLYHDDFQQNADIHAPQWICKKDLSKWETTIVSICGALIWAQGNLKTVTNQTM